MTSINKPFMVRLIRKMVNASGDKKKRLCGMINRYKPRLKE